MVTNVDVKQGEVEIDFMHPHESQKMFNWPRCGDTCYVLMKNILCLLSAPTRSTRGSYKIADADYKNTLSINNVFHENKRLENAKT